MKSYNGFSAKERAAVGAWLRAQYAAGTLVKPTVCRACGQDRGLVDTHQEDYSQPWGPHLIEMPLCYRCHMMVHCRFGNRRAFDAYGKQIMGGVRFAPMFSRDFPAFSADHLDRFGRGVPFTAHAPPVEDLLAAIEAGVYRPKQRRAAG